MPLSPGEDYVFMFQREWPALLRTVQLIVGDRETAAVPLGAADIDLQRAVLRLSPTQRAVIVLHYYEDRPVGEIASSLGCREATVRVHPHRARKRLAGTLQPEVNNVP